MDQSQMSDIVIEYLQITYIVMEQLFSHIAMEQSQMSHNLTEQLLNFYRNELVKG